MATETEIQNWALDKLGADPIVFAQQNSANADRVTRLYRLVRDEIMRTYPWSCLLTRVDLPADATAPVYGWQYQYTLPGECLRLIEIRASDYRVAYKLEGDKVLTDTQGPLSVLYVERKDVAYWDASLRNVVATKLAYELCNAVTEDPNKKVQLAAEFNDVIAKAMHANGMENPTRPMNVPSNYELVRYGPASDWIDQRAIK